MEVPLSTDQEVRSAVSAQGSAALLVNFTASWCQPCKSFAPALAELKHAGAGQLDVMKVDVDACPEIAQEFGVRSIPATILFKQGAEHDRFVGVKSLQGVAAWLAAHEVSIDARVAANTLSIAACAFYGDRSLKEFLTERLYKQMDAGEVNARFMPYWQDGKGSVSAALVRHDSPEVYERITGLPYGLACVFEFLHLETSSVAKCIFDAITPGADLQFAPLRFVHAWLSHERLDWAGALDSSAHDALRRDWCQASHDMFSGRHVGAERWTGLRNAARALATADGDPHHMLEDDLATLVASMSQPPSAFDGDAWRSALLGTGAFSRARLLEYHAGWKKSDTAQHSLRDRWFRQHVPIDSEGRLDHALLMEKRTQWEQDNAGFIAMENDMHEHYGERRNALVEPFRAVLTGILRGD